LRSSPDKGTAAEVFTAFLALGLTSFGGPVAHIGYFRRELVERRKWVDETEFARVLALCQFLPGPASSQLGFSLGLLRAGWPGAFAAFTAFTLPSALLLFAFAKLVPHLSGDLGQAAIHGLKLVAVAIVAQGVLGMARALCPDAPRATIAAVAAASILAAAHAWMQVLVVALGAIAGLVACRGVQPPAADAMLRLRYGVRLGGALLVAFALLLLGLPLAARALGGLFAVAEAFYRAGALVFGGGHVVLPLLRESVVAPGWIPESDFLAGYGAAQAVPGPLFTLSAYLGARLPRAQGGVPGRSSCPASCSSAARCRGGARWAIRARRRAPLRASTPPSSGCWRRRFTIPSGRAAFTERSTSRSSRSRSHCSSRGARRRSSSLRGASRRRSRSDESQLSGSDFRYSTRSCFS